MGSGIGKNFEAANNNLVYVDSKSKVDILGDIVVLAVPYAGDYIMLM